VNNQSPGTNFQIITKYDLPVGVIGKFVFIWDLDLGYWNFVCFSGGIFSLSLRFSQGASHIFLFQGRFQTVRFVSLPHFGSPF
jgi:hypothetical protein